MVCAPLIKVDDKGGPVNGFGSRVSQSVGLCLFSSLVEVWQTSCLLDGIGSQGEYRHIRNYYLSNSETFQDGNGNGNGNFGKINSNDFQDGNGESMEMKGRLRGPRR